MLSGVLLAHLTELVSSINLSYQYLLKEQGLQSISLEYIIGSLYELTKIKDNGKLNEYIIQIRKLNNELPETENNYEEDIKYFYMKSMTYSQFFMTMAICDRILTQEEVLNEIKLKTFLFSIKDFLKNFSIVVIKN
jgi:hypothetical protein